MGIQKWSETIILVNLAKEPQMGEEIQAAIDMVAQDKNCDVVIDFSAVDIVTSSSIAKLLRLRQALKDANLHLVFSSVSAQTREIFAVTGLNDVFEFVDDQFIALAGLQLIKEH